jgi:hypothetical protein
MRNKPKKVRKGNINLGIDAFFRETYKNNPPTRII